MADLKHEQKTLLAYVLLPWLEAFERNSYNAWTTSRYIELGSCGSIKRITRWFKIAIKNVTSNWKSGKPTYRTKVAYNQDIFEHNAGKLNMANMLRKKYSAVLTMMADDEV